jgi:hypothetical protein
VSRLPGVQRDARLILVSFAAVATFVLLFCVPSFARAQIATKIHVSESKFQVVLPEVIDVKVQWSGFTHKTHLALEQKTESGWQKIAERKHLPARGHRTYRMSATVAGSYALRLAAVRGREVESASKFDVIAETPEEPSAEPATTEAPPAIQLAPITNTDPPGTASSSSQARRLSANALTRSVPTATASSGSYGDPQVSCGGEIFNQNSVPLGNFNKMEILPYVVSQGDGMWWAYQAYLWKWGANGWEYSNTGPAEEQWIGPPQDNIITIGGPGASAEAGTSLPASYFTVNAAGYYGVNIRLWWYENGWRGPTLLQPEYIEQFAHTWAGWEHSDTCYLYATPDN